jgi:hypothetical protein
MHRIEIEQVADHDLRAHFAQRLRAFVFNSHHRTYRFALLQQQFGDGAPDCADTARRAGDQNGCCHVFASSESKVGLLNDQQNRSMRSIFLRNRF